MSPRQYTRAHPPHALMSTPSISIMRTGPFTRSAGGIPPRSMADDATRCRLPSVTMTWRTAAPDLMTSLQRSSIACSISCHGMSAMCVFSPRHSSLCKV